MPPKKGKKKPLTPEEQEEVELCWYKYDQQSREFMDIAEFKSLWMNLKADAFDDEETKAMFEKWDADKEKKARYPVFIKELEAEIQAIADPAVREETLGRLADGPQGSTNDYVAKHDLSPEEGVALRGLEGLKCLLKVDDLEELKASKNPAAGIAEVCYGAMCLLANPGDEIVWRECQMWLKDPEGTYFKMFSFFKRVNIGHVDDRRIERCRQFILQQRDWFDHSVISEVDKTAGLIAMWTLLAVRYFDAVDAYKMLPVLPAGEKPEECGDADKVFSTVMPIRTALPKAEEAYLAGRLVVLVDPKGMTKQHFLATNACILDAKDASQLRRKHVREMLVDCVQKGRVLVVDMVDLIQLEQCDVQAAFGRVQDGLYEAVLNGTIRDPTYFQSFTSDSEAQPAPAGFAFYVMQSVLELPGWITARLATAIRVE